MTLEEMKQRVELVETLNRKLEVLQKFKDAGVHRIEICTSETPNSRGDTYWLTAGCGFPMLFNRLRNDFFGLVDVEIQNCRDEVARLLTVTEPLRENVT